MADSSGNQFSWLPNASAVSSALANGQTTFYQPTPGIFVPVQSQSALGPSTAQYLKAGT